MKKIVSTLLCSVMTVCIIPFSASAASMPFYDINEGDWYYDAVNYAFENNIMVGTSETAFSPNDCVTRGMFVTMLANHTNNYDPGIYQNKNSFTDVTSNSYYHEPIEWAYNIGIVAGVGDGKFDPDTPITREQMVTMLYNYTFYTGNYTAVPMDVKDLNEYSDYETITDDDEHFYSMSDYAFESLHWAVANQIISGVGNNLLAARGTATRAQAAQIFMNGEKLLTSKNTVVVSADIPGDLPIRDLKILDKTFAQLKAESLNYKIVGAYFYEFSNYPGTAVCFINVYNPAEDDYPLYIKNSALEWLPEVIGLSYGEAYSFFEGHFTDATGVMHGGHIGLYQTENYDVYLASNPTDTEYVLGKFLDNTDVLITGKNGLDRIKSS